MSDERKEISTAVQIVIMTISVICSLAVSYVMFLTNPNYKEQQQAIENAEGKPVSEIFDDNIVLGYNPTENQSKYPTFKPYEAIKTDNYTITFSDGFSTKEIPKPLCTYVNIENNSHGDVVFDRNNFSSDFSNDSSTRNDSLKSTTIFDGNNQELSEVTIKPKEEEIFILCRDSSKGKKSLFSKWSLKLDDNNTISQWGVSYDKSLSLRVL